MSQLKVELIDHMGNDLRVANVARVSFAKWKEQFDHMDARLIHFLAQHEHSSPFRHTAITIRCSAPIYLARQLVKHQVGMSWNEESRRYVADNIRLFEQEFRVRPQGGIKQGSGTETTVFPPVLLGDCAYTIEETLDAIVAAYEEAVNPDGPYKIAPECARAVLPLSMMTTWVWTGSLTAFFHMYRLRIDGHAQKEAQMFAAKVGEVIEPLFPECWKALKAACD